MSEDEVSESLSLTSGSSERSDPQYSESSSSSSEDDIDRPAPASFSPRTPKKKTQPHKIPDGRPNGIPPASAQQGRTATDRQKAAPVIRNFAGNTQRNANSAVQRRGANHREPRQHSARQPRDYPADVRPVVYDAIRNMHENPKFVEEQCARWSAPLNQNSWSPISLSRTNIPRSVGAECAFCGQATPFSWIGAHLQHLVDEEMIYFQLPQAAFDYGYSVQQCIRDTVKGNTVKDSHRMVWDFYRSWNQRESRLYKRDDPPKQVAEGLRGLCNVLSLPHPNQVTLNYYSAKNEIVTWHQDEEALGYYVLSITLTGIGQHFASPAKYRDDMSKKHISLSQGTAVLFKGSIVHQVLNTSDERINLTLRWDKDEAWCPFAVKPLLQLTYTCLWFRVYQDQNKERPNFDQKRELGHWARTASTARQLRPLPPTADPILPLPSPSARPMTRRNNTNPSHQRSSHMETMHGTHGFSHHEGRPDPPSYAESRKRERSPALAPLVHTRPPPREAQPAKRPCSMPSSPAKNPNAIIVSSTTSTPNHSHAWAPKEFSDPPPPTSTHQQTMDRQEQQIKEQQGQIRALTEAVQQLTQTMLANQATTPMRTQHESETTQIRSRTPTSYLVDNNPPVQPESWPRQTPSSQQPDYVPQYSPWVTAKTTQTLSATSADQHTYSEPRDIRRPSNAAVRVARKPPQAAHSPHRMLEPPPRPGNTHKERPRRGSDEGDWQEQKWLQDAPKERERHPRERKRTSTPATTADAAKRAETLKYAQAFEQLYKICPGPGT